MIAFHLIIVVVFFFFLPFEDLLFRFHSVSIRSEQADGKEEGNKQTNKDKSSGK